MKEHTVEVRFAKSGLMKYISHLDLMRLFNRAVRRAEIPIALSKGFSPHPLISLKRALKLGIESSDEQMTLILTCQMDPQRLKADLEKQMPDGITIISSKCLYPPLTGTRNG
jgi:radical SAM-linked protein